MNKKTIAGSIIIITLMIAGGWYINNQFTEVNQRVDALDSDNRVNEIVQEMLDSRYDECINDAYETYSNNWDRTCWASGFDSDCRLVIADRYQVENDYQNEVLNCLAEYK